MKRILCFIDSLGPGGAQRQFVGLVSMLAEKHYDVKVITYYNIPFYKNILDAKGITIVNINDGGNFVKRVFKVRKEIKNFTPDCVVSYLETPSLIACVLKLTGLKYKLIVSERNTTQEIKLTDRIRFALFRLSDYIVPNSFSQTDFLCVNYKWMKSKTKTIINFVDTSYFSPYKTINGEKGIIRFVAASSVSPRKNIVPFIQAVISVVNKGYHNFSVKWYGDVEETKALSVECHKLIQEKKIEAYFEILPKTNNIVEKYRESDVFVLPSLYEGTPNALCEAMSCGLFVLCGNICDNSRYVSEGINGFLFDPKSVESMVEALTKVLNMTYSEIRKYGKTSREIVLKEFSQETFIEKYINIIEE